MYVAGNVTCTIPFVVTCQYYGSDEKQEVNTSFAFFCLLQVTIKPIIQNVLTQKILLIKNVPSQEHMFNSMTIIIISRSFVYLRKFSSCGDVSNKKQNEFALVKAEQHWNKPLDLARC